MIEKKDIIAAIATSTVGSTIGIVRVSGKGCRELVASLLNKPIKKARYSYLRKIIKGDKILDEVLVIFFQGPKSYTGEDMIEIHCHGGYVNTRRIYENILEKGARSAHRGEFTKRAFFNGKLDLIQAESINNLINSNNSILADNSVKMMNGIFSRRIEELRDKIIEIIAYLEAFIDFPEDDVEEVSEAFLDERLNKIISDIKVLIRSFDIYKRLSDGIKVAIAGKTNVGKSSLLNAILKEEKAIVTNIPGTTRDILEHQLYINGLNVIFFDTAGLRDSEDTVEKIGIKRAMNKIEQSELLILMFDISSSITEEEKELLEKTKNKNKIVVLNKCDQEKYLKDYQKLVKDVDHLTLSLKTSEGFDAFEKRLHEELEPSNFIDSNVEFFIDNPRYIQSLKNVCDICIKIIDKKDIPPEFIAEDLKEARKGLSEIIGEVYKDDILDKIFSTFCIGK